MGESAKRRESFSVTLSLNVYIMIFDYDNGELSKIIRPFVSYICCVYVFNVNKSFLCVYFCKNREIWRKWKKVGGSWEREKVNKKKGRVAAINGGIWNWKGWWGGQISMWDRILEFRISIRILCVSCLFIGFCLFFFWLIT